VRVRITRPLSGSVDGIALSRFLEGLTYDVGTTIGNYLLAQGWAVISDDEAAPVLSLRRALPRPGILIIEDDEDTRMILAQLLEHHGWEPHVAADGVEGLAALKRCRPSLIVLDIGLPRMDGVAFRRAQRTLADQRLASVPVIVVSALHDAADYKQRLHAAEVLIKPFEADALVRAVQSHARPATLFSP
jgi:two-component system, chemotaxis family, chemotaxis protein CheY